MHQHMHMVRHHAPGPELVALAVEEEERVFAEFSDARIAQMTGPDAPVEIAFQLGATLPDVFDLQQMLPLAAPRLGHGVGQSKGDELGQVGKVAVGQIPAFMPAEESLGRD
jgi:hypothetical protein